MVDHDKVNDADADLYEDQENLNTNRYTRFLALDKALPQRDFLQVVDIPTRQRQPYEFKYDPEWLAVLRNTNDLMSLTPAHIRLPVKGIDKVSSAFVGRSLIKIWGSDSELWRCFYTTHGTFVQNLAA